MRIFTLYYKCKERLSLGCLLWVNSEGSVYCDGLHLLFSLSLSVFFSHLQPPGPDRVQCGLHGNCITLSVFLLLCFCQTPTPQTLLLFCCHLYKHSISLTAPVVVWYQTGCASSVLSPS